MRAAPRLAPGEGEAEGADLAEQRALVDPEGPGRGQAVEAVPTERLGDERGLGRTRRVADGRRPGPRSPSGEEVGRQVGELQPVPLAQDEGVLEDVLELPHVAGEVVRHQQAEDFGVDAADRLPLDAIEPGDEVIHEQRDVLPPLAQRRDLDPHHVDAVVEVGPEGPFLDAPLEVAVGGGDHADVRAQGSRATDDVVGPVLQDAQQLHLQARRHVADLVEEERPPLGEGEAPGLVALGAGEGPGLVAEELRLEEGLGERAAVDGDEGPPSPRARVVQGTGEQLLAGSGLALEEHGAIARRHLREDVEDPSHGRTAAHEVADLEAAGELLAQLLDRAEVPEGLRPPDDPAALVAEDGGGDADRKPLAIGAHDEGGPADDGLAGGEGLPQRAIPLAQARPEHLAARAADRLIAADPGDRLRRSVERGHAPVLVHREDAVRDALEDDGSGLCGVRARARGC